MNDPLGNFGGHAWGRADRSGTIGDQGQARDYYARPDVAQRGRSSMSTFSGMITHS